MSVNITVNGKFTKQSQLNDPEAYKKELEHERRKLRLQQVRAQSKELARKIRTDVSQEKERQLRNLEAVKAQELNLWRKNVVAQKSQDYRNALDKVGSAQHAAKVENAVEKEKKIAWQKELAKEKERGKIALAKEQQAARKSPIVQRTERDKAKKEEKKREKRQKSVRCEVVKRKKSKTKEDEKRREGLHARFVEPLDSCSCSFDTNSNDQWSSDEIVDTCEILDSLSLSSSTSSSELDCCNVKDAKSAQTQTQVSTETSLKRIPPVLLDCNTDPVVSEIVVAPVHVVDKHVETNRQFDCVVSMEPEKDTAATQTDVLTSSVSLGTDSVPPPPHYTQISDLIAKQLNAEMTVTQQGSEATNSEKVSEKASTVTSSASFIIERSVPTSAVVSDVVGNFPTTPLVPTVIPEEPVNHEFVAAIATEKIPSSATITSFTAHEVNMPKVSKSLPTTRKAPIARKVPSYPSRLSRGSRNSVSSAATTGASKEVIDRSEGSGSFVQFYDYKNKYAKMYNQPPEVVSVPKNKDAEPNAMEQAALEKQRLSSREKDNEKLRDKSEERGKAALEREKVRRDCVDLTEKLNALTQKRPTGLPRDGNMYGQAFYAEKVARKEAKMNTAIEDLLSRPAIITCPDIRQEKPKPARNVRSKSAKPLVQDSGDLNLGSRLCSGESDSTGCKDTDTECSGSILLGYIDDQRDQIRNELSQCDDDSPATSKEKRERLTQLLARIEKLRESLLREIHNNAEKESEPIGDAQFSREGRQPYEGSGSTLNGRKRTEPTVEERERELKEREMKLQKELAEVFKTQKTLNAEKSASGSSKFTAVKIKAGKEQVIEHASSDKPLEIVIKVKGDKKTSKKKTKPTEEKAQEEKPAVPTVPPVNSKESAASNRRGSYDSNSTAYQSMPTDLPKTTEKFVERIQRFESNNKKQQDTTAETVQSSSNAPTEKAGTEIRRPPKRHLNPLIAQYIQRLLGMSRESVMALEVSSSEVETPTSSVMNITTNVVSSSDESSILTEERLQRVERFVNENRSFISELEESLRSHSNAPLETSLRHFEDIWMQKLKQVAVPKDTSSKEVGTSSKTGKAQIEQGKSEKTKKVVQETTTKSVPSTTQKATHSKVVTIGGSGTQKAERAPQTKIVPVGSQKAEKVEKAPQKKAHAKETKVATPSTRAINRETPDENELQATELQLNQYAELTRNCSTRIAELTALITKVRQEKQRILEVTLTSVSDNERNSTEYADLPVDQKSKETKGEGSSTTAASKKILKSPTPQRKTEKEPTPAPLEKHKQTGRSRDSGISMPSRPVTALDHDTETEPQSYASSAPTTTNTVTQSSSAQRKARPPPPTLHRYSPQLPEEDVVHELSTIVEVDTPATSRLNTSVQPAHSETQQATSTRGALRPIAFPTFEEYIKDLNLDLTLLDPEQSLQMEHEYNELVEALKDGHGNKEYSYEEFPTLISYLKTLTGKDQICHSPETMDDLFGCLRLATIIVKPFPTHREYLECIKKCSPNHKFIDSESLENLTELHSGNSESESETMNIEAELKRRNILKQSFRSGSTKGDIMSTSTGGKEREHPKSTTQSTTMETGIEKLSSTSTDSASEKFHRELLALGLKWHKSMRSKEKQAAALSSSTPDTPPTNRANEKARLPPKQKEKKNETIVECFSDSESSEQPINLRDFLTRQLLKHVTSSSGDSSLSGESLRSQFFMAVLDSMTPSGTPRTNTNTGSQSVGQQAIERQKTSTPVHTSTMQSRLTHDHSKSNEASQPQLFSGESSISFVVVPENKKAAKNKSSNTAHSNTRKKQDREEEGL